MADCTIALIYFSATNVTHTYAQVIRESLLDQSCNVQLFNVTSFASRQKALLIDDFDGFIFGFPVFANFAPKIINEWLPTLDGQGKRCTMFFTYGARTTAYAHFHTKLLLEQAGFQVLFSAEFLGRHSFNVGGWRILPDRPDENDFIVARQYAALALKRFQGGRLQSRYKGVKESREKALASMDTSQTHDRQMLYVPRLRNRVPDTGF